MFALAAFDYRRQQHQLGAFGEVHDLVDHLRDGLGFQVLAMFWTAGRPGTGKQQAQVVVNFGDGAHGRARVVGGGLLLNGDRR